VEHSMSAMHCLQTASWEIFRHQLLFKRLVYLFFFGCGHLRCTVYILLWSIKYQQRILFRLARYWNTLFNTKYGSKFSSGYSVFH
jgi:hypothetical protein